MDIDNRGIKYFCTNCGTKFYDLNKPEAICPKCNTKIEKKKEVELEKRTYKTVSEEKEIGEIGSDLNLDDIDSVENEGDNNEHIVDIK